MESSVVLAITASVNLIKTEIISMLQVVGPIAVLVGYVCFATKAGLKMYRQIW